MSISRSVLETIMREAGVLALEYFKALKKSDITQKAPRDFVTAADVAVEQFLKEKLTSTYPQFGFWGEESGKTDNQAQRWIVDPIDGTHSFAKAQYFWSISVALEIEGEIVFGAIYVPTVDDYYCAEKNQGAWKNGQITEVSPESDLGNSMIATGFACLRSYLEDNNLARFCRIAQKTTGQRRFGSAAMDLCMVADGQVDAFWEQELNLYDVAAGALIVTEAGGTITDFQGKEGIFPKQILATNKKLLPQILPLM
jgi:myo-inositol-1(or 4)-monophosphatase